MSDFIAHLQRRVEDAKRDLDAVNAQIQKANADRLMLMADLEGFERTLSAEMRIQGVSPVASLDSTANGTPAKNGTVAHGEVNKAEFARQFIRDNPTGLLPRDIFRGFQKAEIPIAKAYIYALVQRLERQGAIRQRRDKWYPVLESDKPDLTSEP